MIRSLNTAASGMKAQQTSMDVIANNIANASTTGFKKSRAEFEDLMYQTEQEPGTATGLNSITPTGVQVGHGTRVTGVDKNFDQGSSKVTNGAFDLEIQGAGFFPVQHANGQIAYTRDGSFKKGPDGRLQDRNGNVLQPEISIPPNATGVEVSADGQVNVVIENGTQPQNVGQIQLVNFVNPAGLRAIGGNLFMPTAGSGVPQQAAPGQSGMGTLAQGQLEASNVNIVDEMVNMITTQRSYETNSKVIQASDQMLQAVSNLR
ncbi:MAG: flagellar basal-body rod protein FlgG [Bdellovibrionaceae bacterium]|nr:flagellar basal-body rod protein FlgG [Pseudobdellovibrionaceae bacterium]|tara:strand:+ start:890 stop:1675 length:786 start_codon:yes stop_codon:yes gene_type:complete